MNLRTWMLVVALLAVVLSVVTVAGRHVSCYVYYEPYEVSVYVHWDQQRLLRWRHKNPLGWERYPRNRDWIKRIRGEP